ncbi:MAG: M23 family metallopeptidase [Henriciella sp.]|nr:M23 family metallopeptidase [Henriciella sp.]
MKFSSTRVLVLLPLLAAAPFAGAQEPTKILDVEFNHPILSEAELGSKFGMRRDSISQTPTWHAGVDLETELSSPVYAPADGTITFAGTKPGYGNTIDLKISDDWVVRFAHLQDINAEPGQILAGGTKLGTAGGIEKASEPHIHVEMLNDGKQYDPTIFSDLQLFAAPPKSEN